MYDSDKAKQLQKQSHVRGALSKEFFQGQHSELQKKRREMKRILDQQVEERKRVKERQKQQQERKQRKQEEQIRRYYEDVKQRQRRLSDNGSNFNVSKANQSEGNFTSQNESLVKKHYQQSLKQRASSKATLNQIDAGNIPLMQVMAMSEGQISHHNRINSGLDHMGHDNGQNFYNNFERQNAGNIPLLDLSDDPYALKNKKKSKTQFKKQNTTRQNNLVNHNEIAGAGSNVKLQDSKVPYHHQSFSNNMIMSQHNNSAESTKKKQRRKTYSDQETQPLAQQNIFNSRVSKGSKFQQNTTINRSPSNTKRNTEMEIPEEIEQMENQNKLLKSELKKSQQAISLLIGAVRSNPKLDKFRVQAERILHNADNKTKILPNQEIKIVQKKAESPLLLPKLKIKHQSIMHDYLLEAAKKARLKHIKSQTGKY